MAKYRKKPIVIEANQWWKYGDHPAVKKHPLDYFEPCGECGKEETPSIGGTHGQIKTLEGIHIVCQGDWIITGIKGEVYPCKPDIFEATYEKVEEGGES